MTADLLTSSASTTDQFVWFNDDQSTTDFNSLSWKINTHTNSITYTGWFIDNQTEHHVAVFEPWIAVRIPNPNDPAGAPTWFPVTWDNSLHGWTTDNFNGTGIGLLVTLQILPENGDGKNGYVTAGSIAQDRMLDDVFGPSPFSPGMPGFATDATLQPGDQMPFVDLGTLEPGETPFKLVYTYHWEAGYDLDAYRTASQPFTIAPTADIL